jgi:hypothetical protein
MYVTTLGKFIIHTVGSLTSHTVLFIFHRIRALAFSDLELTHAMNLQTLCRTFGWASARRSTNTGYPKQGTNAYNHPWDERVLDPRSQ